MSAEHVDSTGHTEHEAVEINYHLIEWLGRAPLTFLLKYEAAKMHAIEDLQMDLVIVRDEIATRMGNDVA